MGHNITAIIGKREPLRTLMEQLGRPEPTALAFDLVIIPLDEHRLDTIATSPEPSFDSFTYLHRAMADAIGNVVPVGDALYIETAYFGGIGDQGAALFRDGALHWKRAGTWQRSATDARFARTMSNPTESPRVSPIAQGLVALGVVAKHGQDAFDTLGLAAFRTFEALGLYED